MSPSFAARQPIHSGTGTPGSAVVTGGFTGWRKSTRCDGGQCIEVGHDGPAIGVRDSEDPDGAVLTFSGEAWKAFAASLKAP